MSAAQAQCTVYAQFWWMQALILAKLIPPQALHPKISIKHVMHVMLRILLMQHVLAPCLQYFVCAEACAAQVPRLYTRSVGLL